MLVLTRKTGQSIKIGNDIKIYILDNDRNKIKVGIEAPPSTLVLRTELKERKK